MMVDVFPISYASLLGQAPAIEQCGLASYGNPGSSPTQPAFLGPACRSPNLADDRLEMGARGLAGRRHALL